MPSDREDTINIGKNDKNIRSPLQKVTRNYISNHNQDVENSIGSDAVSLYSFESVSTNARLLDMLGLDEDARSEYNSHGGDRKGSIISTRSLDRNTEEEYSGPKFITRSSSRSRNPNMEILSTKIGRQTSNTSDISEEINVRHGPMNSLTKNKNDSVHSLRADLELTLPEGKNSSGTRFQKITNSHNKLKFPKNIPLYTNHFHMKNHSHIQENLHRNNLVPEHKESPEVVYSNRDVLPIESDQNDHIIRRASSVKLPEQRRSHTVNIRNTIFTPGRTSSDVIPEIDPRRSVSDSTSTASSSVSVCTGNSSVNEERTKHALELRKQGKFRESAYQLKLNANAPIYDSKAMYLYALALRKGEGVKQNDNHAVSWLCRSLLRAGGARSEEMNKLLTLDAEDLVNLIRRKISSENLINPSELYDYYSKLEQGQLSKLINSSKSHSDVISLAYHELGFFIFNGWGVKQKQEVLGIQMLSKAGSMGNVNAMVELGEIWLTKTKYHKKDTYQAASWLRLSEIFGVKSIGNSWIYKEKYIGSKKKH